MATAAGRFVFLVLVVVAFTVASPLPATDKAARVPDAHSAGLAPG